MSAANGARREAARERLTEQGHCLRAIFLAEQWRTIVNNRELENSDLSAGAVVWAAVSGGAALAHPRRTERP